MSRLHPLQRAYFLGLRRGRQQARREAALLVEEFYTELFSVGSEPGAIEEAIGLALGLTCDAVVRITSDDGG